MRAPVYSGQFKRDLKAARKRGYNQFFPDIFNL